MKKRFVIGTNDVPEDQSAKFREYLEKLPSAWWHHLPHFWLVITANESVTAGMLRDALTDGNTKLECIVMEINEDLDWAIYGSRKNPKGIDWTNWLLKSWTE